MHSKIHNKKGFTLLELMFVLMIMGFFIAMIMPRLGSILGTAIDNTCDTNNKGARYWLNCYQKEKGERFPARMINIVNEDDNTVPGDEGLPAFDNSDPTDGPEVLCWEFVDRNKPYSHELSTDEADELKTLGIASIVMLNDYAQDTFAHGAPGRPMELSTIDTAMRVMMIGAGWDGAAWQTGFSLATNFVGYGEATVGPTATIMVDNYARDPASPTPTFTAGHGNPYWMYRMVFGLGPDNALVTGGFTQNAALCPGGIQNTDNVNYNYYTLILPRLQSTIDALTGIEPTLIAVADAGGSGRQMFWNLANDPENPPASGAGSVWDTAATSCGADWQGATTGVPGATPHVFAGNGHSAQDVWEFDLTCPEGHKWPDNDNDMWIVGAEL